MLALVAFFSVRCETANCERLRDELYELRREWETCDSSDDCILIGGSRRDCSGVFSCNVAVNRSYREEAERRIFSLPEETVDCHQCGIPNCPQGDIVFCEPVSQRCIIVRKILDGGALSSPFEPPDAGPSGTGGAFPDVAQPSPFDASADGTINL